MVNVKGSSKERWIKEEFPKLNPFVPEVHSGIVEPIPTLPTPLPQPDAPSTDICTALNQIHAVASPSPASTISLTSQQQQNTQNEQQHQTQSPAQKTPEVKEIWNSLVEMKKTQERTATKHQSELQEINANVLEIKNAFSTIEKAIEEVSTRSGTNVDAANEKLDRLEEKINAIDERLDAKVRIFHE